MNVEELKGELNELEPELKATQDEGNRLTQALAQHRNQVAQLRDQMVAQEERVKVCGSRLLLFGGDFLSLLNYC